jgi:branched-chain amino acid transport system ATP-binding protein
MRDVVDMRDGAGPPGPAPLLTVEDVSKAYGALTVTDGLSMTVAPGEALGIIGPNGAGKSTLFNLIAGATRPDSGRIRFRGVDITALSPAARCRAGIARSYQIPHPFAGMTVFENLLVGATFGAGRGEAAAADICVGVLRRTGLLRHANALAGGLTLLERKRLELARALVTDPKLLLLDEIAGGLTQPECLALVETVRDVHRAGVAIVWIEHVLHALRAIAERLIVIDFGRKIEDGDPDRVMASPRVRAIYLGLEAADA